MDLNLYKTFYIVAKCSSFTKAAEQLYISQPAVTQAVKKLEDQLNVELFKRTSNGISLTSAGEIVYYYAEELYNLTEASVNLINKVKETQFSTIKIGVPTHIGTFYFVKYLKEFNQKHPNVRVSIINKKSDEMLKMLQKRELDIVIDTDMVNIDDKTIKIHKILELESCFVGNERFKNISEKGILSPIELIKYPLILPSITTSNRKMIDLYFKKQNIILKPLIEANSSSISKGIINQGIGIGWMIKDFIIDDLKAGNLYEIKVDIDQVLTPLSIAYHDKFTNEVIKEFINIFKRKTDS